MTAIFFMGRAALAGTIPANRLRCKRLEWQLQGRENPVQRSLLKFSVIGCAGGMKQLPQDITRSYPAFID
jgi:hypothetical protein